MLLQTMKCARQSFSIESLAVSSHVVDDGRDTDSPYLNYLQSTTATVDHNSNVTHKSWPLCRPIDVNLDNNKDFDRQDSNTLASVANTHRRSTHTTSTPKMASSKRRRLCSMSTPPSSPEDSSEEHMVIDESRVYTEDEKLSPTSIASCSTSSTTSDHDNDLSCDNSATKRKKARTAFSGEQLRELEKNYKTQKYLTASDRTHLARALKLKDQQVKTWFQNRRMKDKRQQREEEQSHGFCLPTGGVDVAQLTALGICAPPFAHQLGSPTPPNYQFTTSPSALIQGYSGHSPLPAHAHSPYGLEYSNMCYPEMRQRGDFSNNSSLSPNAPVNPRGLPAPVPVLPSRYESSYLNSRLSPANNTNLYGKH